MKHWTCMMCGKPKGLICSAECIEKYYTEGRHKQATKMIEKMKKKVKK